jgi:ornithine carbamoyltransferase
MKHFISIAQLSTAELTHILDVAERLKEQLRSTGRNEPILAAKSLAMIFEKPSLRTRVSFSVAMTQLGGNGFLLREDEIGLGKREAVQDVARVLSDMCNAIMVRTFSHDTLKALTKHATVPVINALTDYSHPCQAMSDMLTLREKWGKLSGKVMAYVGDGNNVARSLSVACGKFGMRFILAAPPAYVLPADDMDRIMSQVPEMQFEVTHDPAEAVREADVIYTDTWISMGQEQEKSTRMRDFAGFCVDEKLLAAAPARALVMHCLPAYRGLEISEAVLEGPRSIVFPQAENRLHFQKALLAVLMGKA